MKTAVIVPSVGRLDKLENLLASLERCDPAPDDVLIVFQGATRDHVRTELETAHPLAVVQSNLTLGASAARNEGARLADAELLLFVDDDCSVDPGWIAAFLNAMKIDPQIGMAGGQVQEGVLFAPGRGNLGLRMDSQPRQFRKLRNPVGTIDRGGNLAVRASVFRQLSGFDEGLGPGTRFRSAEDCDLVYRAMKIGVPIAYVPGAIVYHDLWREADALAETERGYGVGLGAFIAGHTRAGDWYAFSLLPRLAFHLGLRPLLRGAATGDRSIAASGWRYMTSLPIGFLRGLGRGPARTIDDPS